MLLKQYENSPKDIIDNGFNVVFILGDTQVFKTYTLQKLKAGFIPRGRRRATRGPELREEFKVVRYRPFFRGKWFLEVDYESVGDNGKKQIMEYIKKPSDHCVLVVVVNNFRDRRWIMRNKRLVNNETVAILDYQYPRRDFLEHYIEENLDMEIVPAARNLLRRRLAQEYDEYPQYLQGLNSLDLGQITEYEVKRVVPDLSSYDVEDLVNTIIKLDRVNVPTKALNHALTEHNPKFILNKMKHDFRTILQAKELAEMGFIIADGNLRLELSVLNNLQYQLDYPIVNYPPFIVNKYLKQAELLTKRELLAIDLLLSRYSDVTEEELRRIIYLMLGRRELTELTTEQILDITI